MKKYVHTIQRNWFRKTLIQLLQGRFVKNIPLSHFGVVSRKIQIIMLFKISDFCQFTGHNFFEQVERSFFKNTRAEVQNFTLDTSIIPKCIFLHFFFFFRLKTCFCVISVFTTTNWKLLNVLGCSICEEYFENTLITRAMKIQTCQYRVENSERDFLLRGKSPWQVLPNVSNSIVQSKVINRKSTKGFD